MHNAWILLNIGALLFLFAMIVMFTGSNNLNIVEENSILRDVTLNDTNSSVNYKFNILDINKPFSIAVYSGPAYYRDLGDVDLRATISNSNGQVLFEKEFSNTLYTTIQFNSTGDYLFRVNRNSDEYEVTFSALMGNFPPDSYYYHHVAQISWLGLIFGAVFTGGWGMAWSTLIWVKKTVNWIRKGKIEA
ncbi:MAG TPA: hypothetical protein VLD84_09070 [Nitrososphaeraceae archaeon]|nr:hypothetical protein [Nitrososphaeraceae archaeon]